MPADVIGRDEERAAVHAFLERADRTHALVGHDLAGPEAGLQDELAQVRRVTARFHDLDAALAAGYELGWVNGGNRAPT